MQWTLTCFHIAYQCYFWFWKMTLKWVCILDTFFHSLLVAKVEHKYKCETWKWILELHILLYASQSCRYIKPVLSVGRDAVLHFSLDLLYVYKIFGVYKKRQIFLCSALVCSVFCTFKGKISLWSCLLCSAMVKGPLITDGRNSSKRTGHYVGWLKSCKWLKFLSKIFEKYFLVDNFINKRGYRCHFLHQIVDTP